MGPSNKSEFDSIPSPSPDDEDESQREGPQCVGCLARSPATNTNYTLISARHGWRLTLAQDETGARTPEWRCPTCWARYKQAQR